jgi:GDP-4-dehydro-6-deoxy-D-mannose reductase
MLKGAMGKQDVQFEVDPALVRPTDIMDIYGDSSRLRNELNWQPTHDINQTVKDFVTDAQSN